MCPDAEFVAFDACLTFAPLYKSHPPPSLFSVFIATVWPCDWECAISSRWVGEGRGVFGTCSLERVCLVQGQTLRPKTRVKCDWWKMDTSQAESQSR